MSAGLLPARPRRRFAFMLTPLVDVMFLLLIFFMLSSQTSPYALLKVSAEAGSGAAGGAVPKLEFVVSVGNGFARLNGRRVALEGLASAVDDAMAQGFKLALVTTGPTATAQDLVSVLDVFKRQGFAGIRLIAPPEAAL